ncbi:MAG: hypothetical protein BGO01_00085 [Armatimonadetes bacterium 55-13]|nr:MAG: hypothetical protein ABT09_02935 [bacterium SCN 57-13]OJU63099.1 MAG: hypothetical protein BGO01_00085 [Armatimonadetes bacterium 55-13]
MGLVIAATTGWGQVTAEQPGTSGPKTDTTKIRIDQKLGAQVPLDAEFKDRTGKTVKFGDVLGKRPVLALLIFYKCQGVCSVEFEELTKIANQIPSQKVGKDFDVVVLSIDPTEGPDFAQGKFDQVFDFQPDLKGTEDGWHFLVGDLDNIHKVSNALGFYYTYDPKTDAINHPSGIMFLSPTGKVSSYIYGAKYIPNIVAQNLTKAAKNEVGEKAKEVFFGCIHIDPLTGRKSLVIERVLSILGGITVVVLLGSIIILSRRNRTKTG